MNNIHKVEQKAPVGTMIWIGFTAIGIVLLFLFHGTHVFNYLPYLLLLACPLLHLFMHRGHGSDDRSNKEQAGQDHSHH